MWNRPNAASVFQVVIYYRKTDGTGQISGRIVWDEAMPDGAFMTFRIRVSGGGGVTTTNRVQVTVQ